MSQKFSVVNIILRFPLRRAKLHYVSAYFSSLNLTVLGKSILHNLYNFQYHFDALSSFHGAFEGMHRKFNADEGNLFPPHNFRLSFNKSSTWNVAMQSWRKRFAAPSKLSSKAFFFLCFYVHRVIFHFAEEKTKNENSWNSKCYDSSVGGTLAGLCLSHSLPERNRIFMQIRFICDLTQRQRNQSRRDQKIQLEFNLHSYDFRVDCVQSRND